MPSPPSLTPLQHPLGAQPPSAKFYNPHQVTLALKERVFSITGDDFTVRTADGIDICQVKGKFISMRDKKKFTDMADNELFTLENKMFSIHKSFYARSPNDEAKGSFEIKGKFKLMGSKSVVVFKNAADGKDVELEVNGDWLDRSAEITFEGKVVASISRKFFNAREFFGDKQTYFVAVAGNVDLTMIAACCVALDEKENEG